MIRKLLIALAAAAVLGGILAFAVPASSATAPYHPKVDPAQFTNHITNPYFSVIPGTVRRYVGVRDGAPTAHTFTVTHQTRIVMGVRCVVVQDVVTQHQSLVEKTTDWYAQDKAGNVWYFGEDTAEYLNGVVTSTHGTWEAGVDNAKPGVVIQAKPRVGPFYRQEFRPGIAEDKAKILSVTTVQKVPAGVFRNVVETRDIDPLNPDKKEQKYFAPGVGPVYVVRIGGQHHEEIKLIRYKKA